MDDEKAARDWPRINFTIYHSAYRRAEEALAQFERTGRVEWISDLAAIFGENSARMYKYDIRKASYETDRTAEIKTAYERKVAERPRGGRFRGTGTAQYAESLSAEMRLLNHT